MTAPDANELELPDRLQLIERFAENFGCDLNHGIEAALVSQEVDYVLDLIATETAKARADELGGIKEFQAHLNFRGDMPWDIGLGAYIEGRLAALSSNADKS